MFVSYYCTRAPVCWARLKHCSSIFVITKVYPLPMSEGQYWCAAALSVKVLRAPQAARGRGFRFDMHLSSEK
jgi:hypothetical protein